MHLRRCIRLALALTLLVVLGRSGGGLDAAPVAAQGALRGASVGDLWTGVLAAPSQQPDPDNGLVPIERLIVRFQPRAPRAAQADAHQSARALRADALALENTVRVDVGYGESAKALAAYNARPDVLYAEPDRRVRALYTPNDPQLGSQWALEKVGARAAWDVARGSDGVRVAVLDCGIFSQGTGRPAGDGQAGHPDLRGKVILERDFTGSSTGIDDLCDHGTHVAGIIAAAADNGQGVAGLAYGVSLINGKVLDDNGDGYTSGIVNGVVWATDNGARVINLSLGSDDGCSFAERDAMNYAWQRGVVVVAAAGNSSLTYSGSPASCPNVISVASTTSSDQRSSFSNYGTNVDVAAPGSSILSTVRTGGYGNMSGTSMASPYVAGLAALIWSQNPGASAQSVVDRIASTSDQITGTGNAWAWGRINAARAVSGGVPSPNPGPAPTPPPVACPSPRPNVQISPAPTSPTTMTVTVKAGAGVIREIGFSDLRNVSVDAGTQRGATGPFTFSPLAGQAAFTMTQRAAGQATHARLVVVDDCGPWPTFVGSGPAGFQGGTGGGGGDTTSDIVVRLTWGASPSDLDAHMSVPSESGSQRHHVYWSSPSPVSHAGLVEDERNGHGPETIVVRRSQATGQWVPGQYRVWAHNFSGTPGFGSSSARVTVSRGSSQLGVHDVGAAQGNPALGLWQSVTLTVDASGNATLAPVQQLVSGGSSTVLRFEDGSDGAVQWPAGGKP